MQPVKKKGNENILLTDFLSEVSLLTDQDNEKEGDAEKITLMTIHSAKGLEFKKRLCSWDGRELVSQCFVTQFV